MSCLAARSTAPFLHSRRPSLTATSRWSSHRLRINIRLINYLPSFLYCHHPSFLSWTLASNKATLCITIFVPLEEDLNASRIDPEELLLCLLILLSRYSS
ncbi:Uncharacterized protein HZ326_21932 [Fusarium oxysporum f. sp. albedinis]|nr:Uncharacterized protein HZ326_21932 [Fusarium oxysporum f. sp. albedinis]